MNDAIQVFRDGRYLDDCVLYVPENEEETACNNCPYRSVNNICLMTGENIIDSLSELQEAVFCMCKIATRTKTCMDCKYSYIEKNVISCRRFFFYGCGKNMLLDCRVARLQERVCGRNGKYFCDKTEDIIEKIEG